LGRDLCKPIGVYYIMDKKEEFEKASAPLIKFLNDHANPHSTVIVTTMVAELLSGEIVYNTDEFVKD